MSQNQTSEQRAVILSISGAIGIALVLHILVAYILTDSWVISLFKPEKDKTEKKIEKQKREKETEVVLVLTEPAPTPPPLAPEFPKNLPNPVAEKTPEKSDQPSPKQPDIAENTPTPKPEPELEPEPEVKPDPPKPKDDIAFSRTSDDQLQGKPEDTNIEGERDTLAASNADAVAGAVELPSVKGEKPKHEGHFETVDTHYQDGVLERMNKGAEPNKTAQTPQEQSEEQKPQDEKKSSIIESEIRGEDLKEEALATTTEKPDFLKGEKDTAKQPDKILSNKERAGGDANKETIANKEVDATAPLQKEQPKKTQKDRTIKIEEMGSIEKGFRSEAQATAFQGSITRRSKIASLNVKATPRGKYMARVSKEIEKQWQRIFALNGHVVRSGTLRLSFTVNKDGKVKNMRTISEILGSQNQKGLTFQAIYAAKLPPMPAELKKSQQGEPIEFIYTFGFQ